MPNKHHIGFILNQIHDMYITSPLNIMEETFQSFTNLFVNKMLNKWMNANNRIIDKLSKVNVCNRDNQQIKLYNGRD